VATGEALGPANEQLELRTAVRNGIHRNMSGYQGSPIQMPVPEISPWSDAHFVIRRFLPDPEAGVDLKIDVVYALRLHGDFRGLSFSECDI
jgi:hypothetical protein